MLLLGEGIYLNDFDMYISYFVLVSRSAHTQACPFPFSFTGPFLFPIGALAGEMMMVILAGSLNEKPILYGAASLWPVFFYPMFQQLLKQRRKHFQSKTKKKEIKSV